MPTKETLEAIKKFRETRHYSPFAVFAAKNPDDETIEQVEKIHEKFLHLPEITQNILDSLQTTNAIKKIGEDFKLTLWQIANISRAVRSYYFKELPLAKISSYLIETMGTDQNQAQEITQRLIKEIFEGKPPDQSSQRKLIYLPLAKVLIEYPQLKKQLVTSDSIKTRDSINLVSPSIENWLKDYQQTAGAQRHETMERGDYLFNSANTKRLLPSEREKLAAINRSVDENSDIAVDPEKQIIVFISALDSEKPTRPSAFHSQPATVNQPASTTTQRSLRQLVQENKEILNQVITASPLKIADFDQPLRGTIKNWLADYVKQKGNAKHDQTTRENYLQNNDNAKNLPPKEKQLVAEILKSYDENSILIYDEEKKIILLENASKNPSQAPEKSAMTAPAVNSSSVYREPIEQKDVSSLAIPPSKITSKIDGHVINLKDLQ